MLKIKALFEVSRICTVCVGAFFLLANSSSAAVVDYKPLYFEVQAADQLHIRGVSGDIRFIPSKGKQLSVKVRQDNPDKPSALIKDTLDEWSFSANKVGETIELTVSAPAAREALQAVIQGASVPQFHLEIQGPPLTTIIGWRQGKIRLDGWNASVDLTLVEGEVVINEGAADVKVNASQSTVAVRGRQGKVHVNNYSGKVTVAGIRGPADVVNFSGDTNIEDIEGVVSFSGFKGAAAIQNVRGRVEFNLGEGSLKIAQLNGDLKGMAGQGAVNAQVVAGSGDVRIHSKEGSVSLDLSGSGADINVGSTSGPLALPGYLKAESMGNMRLARGRLRGGGGGGSVFVRTESGAIRIR